MFRPVVDTSPVEGIGKAGTEVTDRTEPRHPPMWTIALTDQVATERRLAATLRAVPARLVSDDHPQADIRVVRLSEPVAGGPPGRVPRVVVADAVDEIVVRAVIRSGAAGIITPGVTVEEARVILTAVVAGSFPIPRPLAAHLATRLEPATLDGLTERDRLILERLAHGDTIRVIAQRLGCSERHTRRHLRTLWNKMGVSGRAQGLVAAAARQGLLNL